MSNSGWTVYQCEVSGKPGLVMIDCSYRARAPIPEVPYLLWFGVYCKMPPGGSIWDPDETESLERIGDDLLAAIQHWKPGWAVYPLKVSTPGIQEYYIYANDRSFQDEIIEEVRTKHPDYKVETDGKRDGNWERYVTFLPKP